MSNTAKAIFWGGLWCGVLDFTSAVTAWHSRGATIKSVGQSVASGLVGRPHALAGGWRTAALGIFLHFVIAFSAATVFVLATRRLRLLTEHPIISGLIYGELVFFFMNMIVLPLSALHTPPLRWTSFSPFPALISGIVGHPFLVGLPIALAARKYAPATRAQAARPEQPQNKRAVP